MQTLLLRRDQLEAAGAGNKLYIIYVYVYVYMYICVDIDIGKALDLYILQTGWQMYTRLLRRDQAAAAEAGLG